MTTVAPREIALGLLATRATEGLEPTEDARLATLLHGEPDLDVYHYELAAASIDLAVDAAMEAVPEDLAGRLLEAGRSYYGASDSASTAATGSEPESVAPAHVVSFLRDEPADPQPPAPNGSDWSRWAGWAVAAAVTGFTIGLRVLTPDTVPPAVAPQQAPEPPAPPAPEERKARLEVEAPDLRRVAWAPTDHPLGQDVQGEVVWSDRRQEGYMTFRGLAWNDPTQRQYQLWVFDSGRSDERPVDGGVFDVPATSREVVIPIDAKLRVDEATLFAITLERPGGVVVSSRSDLLLIAPVA